MNCVLFQQVQVIGCPLHKCPRKRWSQSELLELSDGRDKSKAWHFRIRVVSRTTSFRTAGYIAILAGLILVASGVVSGSILITGLNALNNFIGPSIGSASILIQYAITALLFLIGFGGFLAVVGGILLLARHGSAGRFLIGLGGGMAIFGLLFSMAGALYTTGISAPIFHQAYLGLYWIGAILATFSYFLSRRFRETKPIV